MDGEIVWITGYRKRALCLKFRYVPGKPEYFHEPGEEERRDWVGVDCPMNCVRTSNASGRGFR